MPDKKSTDEAAVKSNTKPIVRSQYYTRTRSGLVCGPSMTQQHFQQEVNINDIVKRYTELGQIPMAKSQAEFGYASSQTFTEAAFTVTSAKREFGKLPSEVRKHFDNDVATYLDAASDPDQRKVFEDFGLLEPLKQEPATDSPVAPADTTPPAETAPA